MIRARTLRIALGLGAMLVISPMLSACDDSDDAAPPDTKTLSSPAPAGAEHLTGTAVFRNPDQNNGETLRLMNTDDDGNLRRIDVNYKDTKRGIILLDAKGHITSLQMTQIDHSIMTGVPSPDGKSMASGSRATPAGVVVSKFDADGTVTGYQADGKILRFVQTAAANGVGNSWRFYQADGKTVMGESDDAGGVRNSLKLYYDNGSLKYQETRLSKDQSAGSKQTYQGLVYNAQGKVSHRVTVEESNYDNGGGSVTTIEEFDSDGTTVKSTVTVAGRWNEPPHPIGIYAGQDDLIKAKKQYASTLSDAKGEKPLIDVTLSLLLRK